MRDIENIVADIEGWLTPGEGKFLYAKAKACPEYAAIVEIGSYKGKSTICLAAGATAGNGAPVYAIDPHTGGSFKEFRKNLEQARVQGVVSPIVKTSEKGSQDWQHPIGMLFIDGDHHYAAVEQDFLLWFPHLIDGGVVALHDTTSSLRNHLSGYPGPKKVAEQYMFKSTAVSEVDFIDTMTFGIKRTADSSRDRVAKAIVRFRKMFPDILLLLRCGFYEKLPPSLQKLSRIILPKSHMRDEGM